MVTFLVHMLIKEGKNSDGNSLRSITLKRGLACEDLLLFGMYFGSITTQLFIHWCFRHYFLRFALLPARQRFRQTVPNTIGGTKG